MTAKLSSLCEKRKEMEPVIRRMCSSKAAGNQVHVGGIDLRRKQENQEPLVRAASAPTTVAIAKSYRWPSSRNDEAAAAAEAYSEHVPLATNKVTLITTAEVGQPVRLSFCRVNRALNGQAQDSVGRLVIGATEGGDRSTAAGTRDGDSSNNNNKSNIINNNNINNKYSTNKQLEQQLQSKKKKKKQVWANNRGWPTKSDRPETMNESCRWQDDDDDDDKPTEKTVAAAAGQLLVLNTNTSGSHCLVSWRRKRIGLNAAWSLFAILILIAYELYLQARYCSVGLTSSSCCSISPTTSQRCLPDVVFIRTCSALELPDASTNNNTASLPQLVATTMMQDTAQTLPSTSIEASKTIMREEENTTTTTTNSATMKNGMDIILDAVNGGSATRPPATVNSDAINKHHHQHRHYSGHHHNVLCNSRCNCVILEPVEAKTSSNIAAANSSWSDPVRSGGSAGSTNLNASTVGPALQIANVNESGTQMQQVKRQQEHQLNLEQALIAFSEDYSLDYDQQQQPQPQLAAGNGPDDAGGADVDPIATAAAGGNAPSSASTGSERTATSRPADQSTVAPAAGSIWLPLATGHWLSAWSGDGSAGYQSPLAATENRPANQSSGTSNNTIVAAAGTQQMSLQKNQANVSYTNNNNNDKLDGRRLNSSQPAADALVVSDSSGSRQRQLQPSSVGLHTGAGQLTASQLHQLANGSMMIASSLPPSPTQRPLQELASGIGSGLFPLPAAYQQQQQQQQQYHQLHHHQIRGHGHYQPLGNGRESSAPQLYAQSLFSSQAPKLSYHAHTPYLKSPATVAAGAVQLQQQQASGDIMSQQQASSASVIPMLSPPSGAGGHQHHHLRHSAAGYLAAAHYQRQLAMGSSGGGSGSIAVGTAKRPPSGLSSSSSIQKLVPLRTMNASQTLDLYATTTTNATQMNQQQIHSSNWTESPEFADKIRNMLADIDTNDVQSLILRNNNIQFELWSELYALLAVSLRQHLYHLDMSHNSLAKLGITFTGYIEHHLAAHGSWPFNAPTSIQQQQQHNQSSIFEITSGGQQQHRMSKPSQRLKHSLLSGGKLYTMVKKLMAEIDNTTEANQLSAYNNNSTLLQPMLLRALDLSHNKLKWLINDQFRALKHVQTIRLDYNRIRYVNQHAFSGLESLKFLNLNFNRLQVIYVEQFQTNYNLMALMLRSNYLAYLRGGSFASLANLRRLDLSKNKLTIMSNNAFVGLESLEVLNCSSNQFVHAPSAALHSLTSLRQLDLSDNLITHLSPGTFFHLPIEQIWLNQNEQLVAIDRGAFWDLPYLRQLYLKWNPMLMSINSQAFVGTQSLQLIDVDGCQSLEPATKQMLDNVTMATTSRLLRYEQAARLSGNSSSLAAVSGQLPVDSVLVTNTTNGGSRYLPANISLSSVSHHIKRPLELPVGHFSGPVVKYVYCLAIVGLLVAALKLVFAHTSTSHYLDARRRRRRVYATKPEVGSELGDDGQSMTSSSADAYQMCAPSDLVISRLVANHRLESPGAGQHQPLEQATAAELGDKVTNDDDDDEVIESSGGGQLDNNDISVISDSVYCLGWQTTEEAALTSSQQVTGGHESSANHLYCADQVTPTTDASDGEPTSQTEPMQQHQVVGVDLQQQQQQQQPHTSSIDLIHSQLVAAGFDYGHANCAHFYQSLGPALQLADLTANFVNSMDYY